MAEEVTEPQAGAVISRAEHYKVVSEETRAFSERRERANQWYASLITLVLGGQGYLLVTFQAADVASAVYTISLGMLGILLAALWRVALGSYASILDNRYFLLRKWERAWFPPEHRVYLSESALYNQKIGAEDAPLFADYRGRKFVSVSNSYLTLPALTRLLFIAIIVYRLVSLAWAYAPQFFPAVFPR
jgi:hypothetical protein